MDPNLLTFLASGAYPSPLPSPQESVSMVFPFNLNNHLLQQELLRQMACQQIFLQQAYSNLLDPTAAPKTISPVMPQQLVLPATVKSEPEPVSPVGQHQSLVAALSSPTPTVASVTLSCPEANAVKSESPKPEAQCVSPSTSSQTKDDEDEELFVDVESVDNKIANKDRRKAHVEFFRKIKSIRQRAVTDSNGEKHLQCAICNDKVPMQDNAIQLHVNLHADAGGYRCQLCGFEMKEKGKLYSHMRQRHPNKVDLIEDRRNINKLSAYIEIVFPRACAKTKKDSTKEVELLLRNLEEKKMPEVACSVCDKQIAATKASLIRHASSHPWYRCKTCKHTTDNEKEQEQHQIAEHAIQSPRLTTEYNLTTAIEIVARQVSRCFAHAMQ